MAVPRVPCFEGLTFQPNGCEVAHIRWAMTVDRRHLEIAHGGILRCSRAQYEGAQECQLMMREGSRRSTTAVGPILAATSEKPLQLQKLRYRDFGRCQVGLGGISANAYR